MKYPMEARQKAADLFEVGYRERTVAKILGISRGAVRKWLYAYRALGKEGVLMDKRRTYSYETKLSVARAVVDGHMSKPEAMERFSIKAKTQVDNWCRRYREGGAEALVGGHRGRPKKSERVFANREEELKARVQELELENEILKRIAALAGGIEQR